MRLWPNKLKTGRPFREAAEFSGKLIPFPAVLDYPIPNDLGEFFAIVNRCDDGHPIGIDQIPHLAEYPRRRAMEGRTMPPTELFTTEFLITLRSLIGVHHSLYPSIPPQGMYFEGLVERSFRTIRVPFTEIEGGGTVAPRHDLLVGSDKMSLKTETGQGTDRDFINITKLCTTERDPWEASALVNHAMAHLVRYDHMLMLRSIWDDRVLHYQLVDIPMAVLRLLDQGIYAVVGRRTGRRSVGADILIDGRRAFHVHFDGSDGKCQVRNLDRSLCNTLLEWDLQISE